MSKFKTQNRLSTRVSVSVRNRILLGTVVGLAMLSIVLVMIIAQMGQNEKAFANNIATSTKTFSDLNFKKVIKANDGNYVMSDGINFIKTDSAGNIIWSKTIDPQFPILLQSLTQASDNSILALSQTTATGDNTSKVYITKLESNGTVAWAKLLSKSASEFAYGVSADKSGNFYLCGSGCTSTNYILKVDGSGNQSWFKDFAVNGATTGAQKILVNDDNSFTVVGKYIVNGAYYLYLNQFNSSGQWTSGRKYTVPNEPLIKAIAKANDGGFIIAGNYANSSNGKPFVMKTDGASNLQWFKSLEADNATSINDFIITRDNNIIVVGNTFVSTNENVDEMILKMDMNGNLLWKVAAGSGSLNGAGYDDALAICNATAGNYFVTGFSGGGFITTMNDAGDGFCHYANFNLSLSSQSVEVSSVSFSSVQNSVYNSADVTISIQNLALQAPDACNSVQQSGNTATGTEDIHQALPAESQVNIYPNPNQGVYNVQFLTDRKGEATIEVFDIAGKQVLREVVQPGVEQYQVNQSSLSSGTYFVTVKEGDNVLKQSKILVQHQ